MTTPFIRFTAYVSLVATLSIVGCSSQEVKQDSEVEAELAGPSPLISIDEKVDVNVVWRETLGHGVGRQNIRLIPAVSGDLVYVADYQGELQALELASGSQVWSVEFDEKISSGVVVDGDDLFIATQDGMLHRLNKTNGEVLWSQQLSSESIAPVVSDRTQVYARTIDGHLTAFSRQDGKQNWTYEAAMPVLTVHGTGAPILVNDLVVTGFANGKLFGLDRELGIPRWNVRLAIPEGRSELERLVDLDGTPVYEGDVVYGTAYHGKLAALAPNGKPVWDTDLSSYFGPALALGNVYVVDDSDQVQAYDQVNGASVWSQDQLKGRYLGAPVNYQSYVLSADFDGYLHVLSQVDGEIVGRIALRPKPLHMTFPNQPEMNNWRPFRGKDFGIRSRLIATTEGVLAYTNAGELILLQLETL